MLVRTNYRLSNLNINHTWKVRSCTFELTYSSTMRARNDKHHTTQCVTNSEVLTFPRHIWHEIGRVMEREVEETETFLFAMSVYASSGVMPYDLLESAFNCLNRDILGLLSLTLVNSGRIRSACSVNCGIQHGGNFKSDRNWWLVEKSSCILCIAEISPDTCVVPFTLPLSICWMLIIDM